MITSVKPDVSINVPAPVSESVPVCQHVHIPGQLTTTYHSSPNSLQLDLRWIVIPNLHDGLPRPLTHNRTNISDISNLPNTLGRFSQIPNILTRLRFKQSDPPVIPTSDEEVLVELESGHGRIVGGDALEDGVGFE